MSEQKTVYLSDYQPYSHVVESVDLTFRLSPQATRVLTRLALRLGDHRETRGGGPDAAGDGGGEELAAGRFLFGLLGVGHGLLLWKCRVRRLRRMP